MAYEDLLKDNSVSVDNNKYFLLTINDLDINTSYPIQFRWKYDDGSFGVWSAVKTVLTPGESTPATPSTLTVVGGAGILTVTWDGKDSSGNVMSNLDRLDIYIDGAPFDATKPAASFFVAGTQTISAPAGTYIVAAYAVSKAGTKSAVNSPVTRTVTSNAPTPQDSVTPSAPTVSSVLGAIQLSWNGKTSTGGDQPYGFDAAKVYVGTSSSFTTSSSNQVDTLNFANGQNTLNIGVGTIVNGTALDYGIDYYVKIATTNGTDTSVPVSAIGNPVRIGQVTSGDIVTITADKIATGTLSAGSTITVGSPTGKHVTLAGTGDPLTIYDTNGTTKLLSYSTTSGRLSIVGDGSFTGNLSIGSGNDIFKAEPATGIWLGNSNYDSAPFSVAKNGVIKANSGTIGGWTLASSYLEGTNFQINSSNSTIYVGPYASGDHIRISASGGIVHTNSLGSPTGNFTLTPNGSLSLSGTFTIGGSSTIDGTAASTVKSGAASGASAVQSGNGVSVNSSKQITTITPSSGLTISTASSGSRIEINNLGLKAYSGTTNTVSINSDGTAEFTGSIKSGSTISGSTITGGVINTAASGERISINETANSLNFYPNLSVNAGFMKASIINESGSNYGKLEISGPYNSGHGRPRFEFYSLGAADSVIKSTADLFWTSQAMLIGQNLAVGGTTTISGTTSMQDVEVYSTIYADTLGTTTRTPGSGVTLVQSTTGYIKVYVSSSSQRYKENIITFGDSETYNIIKNMRPVTFNYKPEFSDYPEQEHLGLIAEEVHQLEPNGRLVVYKDGVPESVVYEKIPMYLVSAFKEMANKIDSLQSKLDALEG